MNLREKIEREHERNRPGKARELRATAVVDQYRATADPYGRVIYGGVEFLNVAMLGDGAVVVRTAPGTGEDDYRIFNPPTLVRDGAGTIIVNGKRYREDPLGAVAEVIRQHRTKSERGTNR